MRREPPRRPRCSRRGGLCPARGEPRPPPLSFASLEAALRVPARPPPSPRFQSDPAQGEEFPHRLWGAFTSSRLFCLPGRGWGAGLGLRSSDAAGPSPLFAALAGSMSAGGSAATAGARTRAPRGASNVSSRGGQGVVVGMLLRSVLGRPVGTLLSHGEVVDPDIGCG